MDEFAQFEESAEDVAANLALLESIRWARKTFEERLCDASDSDHESVYAVLRLEAMYHLAEFFYQLKAWHIATVEQIEALALGHNQYISKLSEDRAKLKRLGLRRDRILDAIFTSDTLPRLLLHWRESPGSFDQSNLSRLLATLMSTETCRKLVVAAAKAGFVTRKRTPYGTILISSTGTMERIFGSCLCDLRAKLKGASSE